MYFTKFGFLNASLGLEYNICKPNINPDDILKYIKTVGQHL